MKSIPVATTPPKVPTQRGQIPEEPVQVRIPSPEELGIRIPSPEEVGIGSQPVIANDAPVDWNMVERKLDQVGATGYQMEKLDAGFRFTVQLPTRSITGRGATKGEAVRHALSQLAK